MLRYRLRLWLVEIPAAIVTHWRELLLKAWVIYWITAWLFALISTWAALLMLAATILLP